MIPKILGLTLTSRCNLNCEFCGNKGGVGIRRKEMTAKTLEQILDLYPSVSLCRIGPYGEPTLAREYTDILNVLIDRGIEFSLITNGTHIKKLPDSVPFEKAKSVNISLNECDEKRYREATRSNCFQDVIRGIEILREREVLTSLSFVISRSNVHRTVQYAKFTASMSVGKAVFTTRIGGLPETSTPEDMRLYWREALTPDLANILRSKRFLTRSVKTKVIWPWIMDREKPVDKCPLINRRLDVDGRGDVAICCGGVGPRREMGNVFENGPGIINRGQMKKLRERIFGDPEDRPKKCKTCRFNYEGV